MPLKRIEQLLKQQIGLHAESIGTSAVQVAVRARMSASGAASQQAYLEQIGMRPDELSRLVDEVVVRETWFFREPAAFALLGERFTTERAAARPFRFLSVPCATGEEPYSMAMTLLRAGLAASDFEIHAVDVSARSIELAQRGVYTSHSFRLPVAGYDHYFERGSKGMSVVPAVRERVSFQLGNLLDPQLCPGAQFDAIFCRNLLIYFDRDARSAALTNLRRLLREDGLIFAGHSESLQFVDGGFRGVGDAGCFAFERMRPERATDKISPPGVKTRTSLPGAASKVRSPRTPAQRSVRRVSSNSAMPALRGGMASDKPLARRISKRASLRPSASLDEARALADRGELAAACKCCEAHLASKGPSAAGFCLLGVIKQASGDSRGARECFDKAVYMESDHYEALSHIALLAEQAGDADAARSFRRRAERARAERARKEST